MENQDQQHRCRLEHRPEHHRLGVSDGIRYVATDQISCKTGEAKTNQDQTHQRLDGREKQQQVRCRIGVEGMVPHEHRQRIGKQQQRFPVLKELQLIFQIQFGGFMIRFRQILQEISERNQHHAVQYPKNAAPIQDCGQGARQRDADDKRQGTPHDIESQGTPLPILGRERQDRRDGQHAVAVGGNPHQEPDNQQLHKILGIDEREGRQNRRKQHQLQHPAAFDRPEQDQSNRHPKCGPIRIHRVQQTGLGHRDAQRNSNFVQNAAEDKSRHGQHKAHCAEDQ